MNNTVLVKVLVTNENREYIESIISELSGDEFKIIQRHDDSTRLTEIIYCKVGAEFATFIRLQHPKLGPFLSVSSIPESVKDLYRR